MYQVVVRPAAKMFCKGRARFLTIGFFRCKTVCQISRNTFERSGKPGSPRSMSVLIYEHGQLWASAVQQTC